MASPRPTNTPTSGRAIAAIVITAFAILLLAAVFMTGPPDSQTSETPTTSPAVESATTSDQSLQQPATGPADVQAPEVPVRSQQPADTSNPQTAPDGAPESRPVAPSPNVPPANP
jgi:hypothetical protein